MVQLIHGTFKKEWPSIEESGLHNPCCVTELPNSGQIIPGMTRECDAFIYLAEDIFDKYTFESCGDFGYKTESTIHPTDFQMVVFVPSDSDLQHTM